MYVRTHNWGTVMQPLLQRKSIYAECTASQAARRHELGAEHPPPCSNIVQNVCIFKSILHTLHSVVLNFIPQFTQKCQTKSQMEITSTKWKEWVRKYRTIILSDQYRSSCPTAILALNGYGRKQWCFINYPSCIALKLNLEQVDYTADEKCGIHTFLTRGRESMMGMAHNLTSGWEIEELWLDCH
jgi:hypothetical protein